MTKKHQQPSDGNLTPPQPAEKVVSRPLNALADARITLNAMAISSGKPVEAIIANLRRLAGNWEAP